MLCMLRVPKVKEARKQNNRQKQAYCFVAILSRVNYVAYHPFISLRDLHRGDKKDKLRRKAHMGNRKKADLLSTFISPSMPVAAATIPVPPFGSLQNNFVA